MTPDVTSPVTRQMVARRAQVSTAVVSYVVNNGPRPVASETRARVLRVIDELGYRPNGIARALRLQKTETYGLLVPDNSNPYFAQLAKAVEDAAFARHHALLLGNSSNDASRELAQLQALSGRQVDGLMVISTDAHPDFSVVSRNDLPLVLLDRVIGTSAYPSVSVDNRAGAYEAVQHLLGHRLAAIDYIAGVGESPAALDRETGWRQAQENARVQLGRIERASFSRRGGYDAARRLLDSDQRPTAIFAASDVQAVGAIRACHDSGLHIPDDIAIVAFDGTEEAEFTAPPLSVVAQPIVEIAETAVRILAEGTEQDRPVHHTLTHTFIARASCGC